MLRLLQFDIGVRLRNFVESVGDGSDQLFYTFAGGRGNRVKFQMLFGQNFEFFELRSVGGRVKLRRDDDDRFVGRACR